MFEHLSRLREGHSRRASSWDTTGGNADAWPVEPGETKTLADQFFHRPSHPCRRPAPKWFAD